MYRLLNDLNFSKMPNVTLIAQDLGVPESLLSIDTLLLEYTESLKNGTGINMGSTDGNIGRRKRDINKKVRDLEVWVRSYDALDLSRDKRENLLDSYIDNYSNLEFTGRRKNDSDCVIRSDKGDYMRLITSKDKQELRTREKNGHLLYSYENDDNNIELTGSGSARRKRSAGKGARLSKKIEPRLKRQSGKNESLCSCELRKYHL